MPNRFCAICGKKLDWKEEIGHHLNYAEAIKITVCRSCHSKIHLSKDEEYIEYRPVDKRPKPKPKYKLVPCSAGCGKKTRVLISTYEKNPTGYYRCSRCEINANRVSNYQYIRIRAGETAVERLDNFFKEIEEE